MRNKLKFDNHIIKLKPLGKNLSVSLFSGAAGISPDNEYNLPIATNNFKLNCSDREIFEWAFKQSDRSE